MQTVTSLGIEFSQFTFTQYIDEPLVAWRYMEEERFEPAVWDDMESHDGGELYYPTLHFFLFIFIYERYKIANNFSDSYN